MISRLPEDGVDGIRDYTLRLCDALASRGVPVDVVTRRMSRWVVSWPARSAGARDGAATVAGRVVVIQYNPFMYGRWGVAPQLVLHTWRLRRSGAPVFIMVHEPFMPFTGWRETVMGVWQRIQLRALAALSDGMFTSVDAWATRFARWRPRRPAVHLPVGSNLPDMRSRRLEARTRLRVADDDLVIATLGTDHPSHLREHVREAVLAIVASHTARVVVLELGARSPRLDSGALGGTPVVMPGSQAEEDLATSLSAADIFLAAFLDGATTRRSTLMAALQHGLPVVATASRLTDSVLRRAHDALILVPAHDVRGFAAAATALSGDRVEMRRRGERARQLYEREFDWSVIADRLLAGVAGPARARDRETPW